MLTSRVFLGLAWLSASLLFCGFVHVTGVQRKSLISTIGVVALFVGALFMDHIYPMPTPPTPPQGVVVARKPCTTPFRPGLLSGGNITENGQTGFETSAPLPKITSVDDSARNDSAMVDAKRVGSAHLEGDTTEGNGQILKADTIDKVTIAHSHASGDAVKSAIAHVYNVEDWFEFLEEYEQDVVDKQDAKANAAIYKLRKTLTLAWQSLPARQRQANEKELETALTAIKGKGFNPHYRDWPPTFVDRPCD